MSQLQSEVTQTAAALQQAVGRYAGVAEGADLPGAALGFDQLATERTDDSSARATVKPCASRRRPIVIPIPSGCTRRSRLGWIRTTHPGRRPGRHCRMQGDAR